MFSKIYSSINVLQICQIYRDALPMNKRLPKAVMQSFLTTDIITCATKALSSNMRSSRTITRGLLSPIMGYDTKKYSVGSAIVKGSSLIVFAI